MPIPGTVRLAIVITFVFSTAVTRADTLLDIYQQAKASDPQLLEAEAAYLAVAETKNQAQAQLFPQLALSGNLSRNREDVISTTNPFFPPATFYSNTKAYNLNLSQALYHRDFFAQLHESDAAAAQAKATYQAAQQDLAVRTRQ